MLPHSHTTSAFFNRQRITEPRYFFGRHRAIEALYSAVLTRQCRSIVGERKLGKSSLLTYITNPDSLHLHGIDPARYVFLYIDLEGMANIARDEFWPEVIDRLALLLPAGELREQFSNAALAGELRFMQVRRLLRRLNAANLNLVLMLDEFESLATNEAFDPTFYGELRSLAGELGVVYITASKRSLYELTYQHVDTLSSPFFNIFSEIRLSLFSEEEAKELLGGLAALAQRPFTDEQIITLVHLAGPHPFFLQLAGSYLETALDDIDHGHLTLEALMGQVRRRFLAEAEDHYRYLWNQLSPNDQTGLFHLDRLKPEEVRELQAKALLWDDRPFSAGFSEFLARRRSRPETQTTPITPPETADTDNLTGITLGNYRVLSVLGRGGMATVYQGYQSSLDRYVAIKVISSSLQSDPEFLNRFRIEAEMVAKLRHQNIVQMLDFGIHGPVSYMVMEYIDGPTLKEYLRDLRGTGRKISAAELAWIISGVASALEYAHDHGFIHRDIKPANIMLRLEALQAARGDVAFTPILTDFGVAKILERAQQTTGGTIGTPDYMSPEQARGEPAGPRSDIYALGVVVYEIVTGRLPFTAETPLAVMLQHLQAEPPSARTIAPDTSLELETVLARALAKDALARYARPTELAAAVAKAVKG